MPSFQNILPAAIAAAVAVPLLLVLYFLKLRRREVEVPSTLLWRKAIQDLQVNAPFQRLRKSLLLLLQLLLLALLVLALSRPVMNAIKRAGKLTVIMIDRSASMSSRDVGDGDKKTTRLDEAKRQAKELVDSLGKDSSAMVIAFDDSADIVRSFTEDRALLKNAIDSIGPTDRRSRLKTAFQLAEAKSMAFVADQRGPGGPKPEAWLYSDGKVSDTAELALRGAELTYNKIGSDGAPNLAVVALSARRNFERPNEVQVFARLANYGPEPARTEVQLVVDGQVRGVKRGLLLFPDRWSKEQQEKYERENKAAPQPSVEFELELLSGAVVKVEQLNRDADVLAVDDSATIIVPPPKSLNVLLVTPKGNLWLENFLAAANLKDPQTVNPAAYIELMKDPQAVAAKFDVIMFDNYQPEAIPPAGNFIYFKAVPPNTKLVPEMDNGIPVLVKDELVLDWERGHPILRRLNLKFLAAEALKLKVPTDAQVLVEGQQGPMVVLYHQGRSTHLVVNFDIQRSTWPSRTSFPTFLDHSLQYLALGDDLDIKQSYAPGATVKIPRYNLLQAGANLKEVRITGPGMQDTPPVKIPDAGDFALPALEKVGVYTLDPAIPQFEKLAVSLLDENESNILPESKGPGLSAEETIVNTGRKRLDLWWWIVACGVVPLCLIEWWVYTRRMHL